MTRTYNRVCQCCGTDFNARHPGAKWCSSTCTMRAYQRRRRGAPEADKSTSLVIHTEIVEDCDELPLAWRRPYAFDGQEVRVTTDQHGVPWFIAADVCAALGLGNSRQAITRLDDDERGVISTDTPYGKQPMNAVNEPGLYSLILSSRKPDAKRFKRWVTHEVLPAIRRTGSYAPQQRTLPLAPGIHVVASNPRQANWLWGLAVEQHVSSALMTQIAADNSRRSQPSYQLHLLP